MASARGRDFECALEYGLECIGRSTVTLKPEQAETVWHIYNGKDVFVWLPTGFGKSVCYELLLFILDYKQGKCSSTSMKESNSAVLVISPLVSLMLDQVSSLRERGVSAGILTGHAAVSEQFTVKSCSIDRYST